jgi:hypothetical protein
VFLIDHMCGLKHGMPILHGTDTYFLKKNLNCPIISGIKIAKDMELILTLSKKDNCC